MKLFLMDKYHDLIKIYIYICTKFTLFFKLAIIFIYNWGSLNKKSSAPLHFLCFAVHVLILCHWWLLLIICYHIIIIFDYSSDYTTTCLEVELEHWMSTPEQLLEDHLKRYGPSLEMLEISLRGEIYRYLKTIHSRLDHCEFI